MTDRSAVAFRVMGSRATLLGTNDSLASINTTEIDNGALCYVAEVNTHYSINKLDNSTPPNPPAVIAPAQGGPGRWTVATGGAQGMQGAQGARGAQGAQGTQGAGFQGAQGATGTQGAQGSQGTQGAGLQGAQGPQGSTGVQGSQGSQGTQGAGAQGAQGATGTQGAQGSQGTQGAGAQGAQGATGTQGAQGSQGTQGAGAQGAQGATGVQGAQGSQGVQGAGAQGAQGGTGVQGSQGSQGATGAGAQGAQGSQGGNGAQGAQGATGTQGTQGNQGAQGATGLQGTQGFQGARGLQGLQGLQGSQGNTGNQGAQGATGVQGLQGLQGAQGNTGLQGNQGATGAGTQGAQGATGTQGSQGSQGATGAGTQGAQGATGVQGSQGFQGATGSGAQGAQGNQGAQGATGTQGTQGFQGARGFQGFQGFQGATGTQGSQGFQGFQGLTGAQGSQGFQGATGVQGSQGATGAQGFQGAQGASAAAINPLTQVFYVDSANAGAATGSIAQPYASPTAAFAAHTTGNITLLIAPATYATALTLSGDRNITMIGLCEPGDQTVILGSVAVTFATNAGHTLTLQNIKCSTVTDSSAVQSYVSLIDVVTTGTITGSGVTSANSVLLLSSVNGGYRPTTMRTENVTQFYQVLADKAYINGTITSLSGISTINIGQSVFGNCFFNGAVAAGPLICTGCYFNSGMIGPNSSTKNYYYDCQVLGSIGNSTGQSDSLFFSNCHVGISAAATDTLGPFTALEFRGCKFGPKTSGKMLVDQNLTHLSMDSVSEKSFWGFGDGRGQMTLGGLTTLVYTALDMSEENGQPMGDANLTTDPSTGATRVVMGVGVMTADRSCSFSLANTRALMFYQFDCYDTNSHNLAIKFGATTLVTLPATGQSYPVRVHLQVTDDAASLVYVSTENL